MKHFMLLTMLFAFVSCYDSSTTLKIIEDKTLPDLELIDSFDNKIKFNQGNTKAKILLNKTHANLVVEDSKKIKYRIPFKIKNKDSILYTNETITLEPKESGQPITLVVRRDIEKDFDIINISFLDPKTQKLLATAQVKNHNGSDKRTYDENKNEFLSSYQKLKASQRSLVFEIDGAVDQMLYSGFDAEDALDNVVNYGAAVYISPWAYSRYTNIHWIISDQSDSDNYQSSAWQLALNESPVVDYVSWVHSGEQEVLNHWLKTKKENQLRMVYIGACYSGNSSEFISDYNAIVTSGHRNVSASPIFQFSFFRNWSYGRSFQKSIESAWFWGNLKVKTLEFITFAKLWQDITGFFTWDNIEDMLFDSEMAIAFTNDNPAENVSVDISAIRSQESKNILNIMSKYAHELD